MYRTCTPQVTMVHTISREGIDGSPAALPRLKRIQCLLRWVLFNVTVLNPDLHCYCGMENTVFCLSHLVTLAPPLLPRPSRTRTCRRYSRRGHAAGRCSSSAPSLLGHRLRRAL